MKKQIVIFMLICMVGFTACNKASGNKVGNNDETTSASEIILENGTDSKEESKTQEVKPGGTAVDEIFDIEVSYANWAEITELHARALNTDKMMMSSAIHLPIYKFDTLSELEQFKTDFSDVLTMDRGYDEVPAFNDVTVKYDEKFFSENSLMLVYVGASSGSDRFGVNSIYCADGKFCVDVEQINSPDVGTCDMAGWFITVAVPDSMIEDCSEFDAVF